MAEKKLKKEKFKIATREPQKPKPGIFDNFRKGQQQNVAHPMSEFLQLVEPDDTHTTHPIQSDAIPSNDIQPVQPIKKPVSPVGDFQKVPNSITRDGIPNKLFKGTSKNTYDALYLKTRGAIKPSRTIIATKRELMKWIGVSHVTIFKHLKHLESVGLLKIEQQLGSHDGSVYEVFIPEELQPDLSHPILPNATQPIPSYDSPTNAMQSNNVERDASNNLVSDRMGQQPQNIDSNDALILSLKTKNNIDDEFAPFVDVLRSLGKGKPDNWRKLGELLKREFLAAESYTDSVTDAPAFLTEHLKRKLEQPAKAKSAVKEKPFEPGKVEPATATFTPEPLSEKGRETVLDNLRKMPPDEIETHRDAYTAEDWSWLISRLK